MQHASTHPFRRLLVAFVMSCALSAVGAITVLAGTGNPAGTGQPGAECGEDGAELEPAGFMTGGFEIAEARYAGSEGTPSLLHAASGHAVSQYDIACVHFTASHGD